jgi:hypothetical protein
MGAAQAAYPGDAQQGDAGKGRSFDTLKRVTGTPDDELRRLLVELGARGFTRKDGKEAWIYKEMRPLMRQAPGDSLPPSAS